MSSKTSVPVPFGERLRELLQRLGPHATQVWIAERSGLDRSLISRVMSGGRAPTHETLAWLAPVLNVSVQDLVAGTDAEERGREHADHVRRADYEGVLAQMIEFESKNRELRAQLDAAEERTASEQRWPSPHFADTSGSAKRRGSVL